MNASRVSVSKNDDESGYTSTELAHLDDDQIEIVIVREQAGLSYLRISGRLTKSVLLTALATLKEDTEATSIELTINDYDADGMGEQRGATRKAPSGQIWLSRTEAEAVRNKLTT